MGTLCSVEVGSSDLPPEGGATSDEACLAEARSAKAGGFRLQAEASRVDFSFAQVLRHTFEVLLGVYCGHAP